MSVAVWLALLLTLASQQVLAAGECTDEFLLNPAYAPVAQLDCLSAPSGEEVLRRLTDKKLRQLMVSVYQRAMLQGEKRDAAIVRLLVESWKSRHPDDRSRDFLIPAVLLMTGLVEEAESAPHKSAPIIPRTPLTEPVDGGDVRYWEAQGKPISLMERNKNLHIGHHIVIYCAPGCPFCRAAADEIASSKLTRAVFRQKAIFIEVPEASYSTSYYESWRYTEVLGPINLIFNRDNWPKRSIPATPYFFLIKDGDVVEKFVGWTEDRMGQLVRLLARNGFLVDVSLSS